MVRWVLSVCAIWLAFCAPAHAQRVALVIGESAYRTVSPLANPGADANLVANALARAGFDVRLGLNLDKAGLETALDDFARDAQQADVAAVYFAGHGFEASGRNWLVPIDAAIEDAADLPRAAVPFETVARSLAGARVKIVALDACRDNPFAARIAEGAAINRGLAEVELDGYVIVYAAAAGAVALDGTTNSPFATSFARWVSEPNVDLRLLAARIRDDVSATTNGAQRPFVAASLSGDVTTLSPAPAGRVRGAAATRTRPSATFDFVRRVRDENCFETREVRCATKSFGLIEGGRILAFDDDDRMRLWDPTGANLQRTEAIPANEGADFAVATQSYFFSGSVQGRIGVWTDATIVPLLSGQRREGSIEQEWSDPALVAVTGTPPVAVFRFDDAGACRLGFADLTNFEQLGAAIWAGLDCGRPSVAWFFGETGSNYAIASVAGSGENPETLLLTLRPPAIVCRIPGASPDAAFNRNGGFHVASDSGTVVAYDRRCRAVRTDLLHRGEVIGVYPFDRTRMMSRSVDGVLKVWTAARGAVERELSGLPRAATIQDYYDKAGGAVLILNEDRRLYVWTGEARLGAYVGPSSPVCSGRLSTDANTLYARRCDGALEVWRRRGT